jgi:hypothetical protein
MVAIGGAEKWDPGGVSLIGPTTGRTQMNADMQNLGTFEQLIKLDCSWPARGLRNELA